MYRKDYFLFLLVVVLCKNGYWRAICNQPRIISTPPIGVMAPSFFTPVSTKRYKDPEKMAVPTAISLKAKSFFEFNAKSFFDFNAKANKTAECRR